MKLFPPVCVLAAAAMALAACTPAPSPALPPTAGSGGVQASARASSEPQAGSTTLDGMMASYDNPRVYLSEEDLSEGAATFNPDADLPRIAVLLVCSSTEAATQVEVNLSQAGESIGRVASTCDPHHGATYTPDLFSPESGDVEVAVESSDAEVHLRVVGYREVG